MIRRHVSTHARCETLFWPASDLCQESHAQSVTEHRVLILSAVHLQNRDEDQKKEED